MGFFNIKAELLKMIPNVIGIDGASLRGRLHLYWCNWCDTKNDGVKKKEKLRKQQKAPHINKGKGGTWEEKPLHQKRKGGVSEDQEGCGQTIQQTSPDWFEGGENAQENVWSEQAYEHSAQNEHASGV